MPTSHIYDGGPGHEITVGQFEVRGVAHQAWAKCTCGWSRQDIMFTLTDTAALAHARQAKAEAKADRAQTE